MALLEGLLGFAAALVALPLFVLFLECVVSLFPLKRHTVASSTPNTAILIPAHNEEAVLGKTLASLQQHLNEHMRVVIIADNCSDATAEIGRAAGMTVLERFDDNKRGKGYALDYGLRYLDAAPPEVVVMLDADCTVETGGVDALAKQAHQQRVPVQGVYLMKTPDEPSTNDLVSAFAFLVKNLVRPRGLYNLGQPCLLTGTGMAFPWEIIRHAPLASGNIVEDMQLGYDLALAGHSPQLAPTVQVWGELPDKERAATTQRTRWEHGHLQTLINNVPRLLKVGVTKRRLELVTLALDLLIPPLALLVLIWLSTSAIAVISGMIGVGWVPAMILGVAGLLMAVAIGTAWVGFGRETIPLTRLLAIPLYIAWKIPLYLKFIVQRQTAWIRTERSS